MKSETEQLANRWRSALYEGKVWHQRSETQSHQFQYSVYFYALDLQEVTELFEQHACLSVDRWNVASFRRSDHLGLPEENLQHSVQAYVLDQLGLKIGRVVLLTQLRHFGFVMNPVSFYYCYAQETGEIAALVAEVNNTPWGEQHCYCFRWPSAQQAPQTPKVFHVSPFFDLGMTYHWQVTPPEESVFVGIQNFREEELLFEAQLKLKRIPIQKWTIPSMLLKYPMMSVKTFLAIYWQALRLWGKGVPYVPHPKASKPELD